MTMKRTAGALLALGLLLPASALGANFLVNDSGDTGDGTCDATCTLRDAIDEANGNGAADTITFDQSLAGQTIVLSSGELLIATDLTIEGPLDDNGTPNITVDANHNSRVFEIGKTDPPATAKLQGLVITGGNTFAVGSGIFNDGGTLTVTNSTISDNSSGSSGGGIENDSGTLTITNSTISDNSVGQKGGGIRNHFGTVTVIDSTISGNSATGSSTNQGGGIFNEGSIDDAGTVTVTNSTISGNSAGSLGGGIFNHSYGALTVANSTISGNSAGFGGGGIRNVGTLDIKSTIVAGNTDADCSNNGTLNSLGYNIEGGTSCGFTATDDQQNVAVGDLLMTDTTGALQLFDNGGPTLTIALVDTDANPAVDAIPVESCTNTQEVSVTTDQRGVSRPQPADGACDIGAFELVQGAPATIADVIDLFDRAVDDGTLVGAGPGSSAAGRLNALRNMLLAAGDLLAQGENACGQLQAAADRTDGAAPPPDFVQDVPGDEVDAAADLLHAITGLQDDLGCAASG